MKMEWLRQLALAGRPAELAEKLQTLAAGQTAGEAVFWRYDPHGWRLVNNGQQHKLDEDSLETRCVLKSSAQTTQDAQFAGASKKWAHVAAVPVKRYGSLLGVLVAGGPATDAEELETLAEVYALLAEPVGELDRSRQALTAFNEFTIAAVEGLENLPGHIAGVCQLTADLAEYLDCSQQARSRLWNAGLYHDLGKTLLRHHGGGDLEREHPRAGAQLLESSELYRELAPLVLTHHERFDGSGFPQSLSGDDLSLEQWVLVLAEDFEEFNELNRTLGFESRIEIFFQDKARGHHPEVIDALAGLVDSGRLDRFRYR